MPLKAVLEQSSMSLKFDGVYKGLSLEHCVEEESFVCALLQN